MLDTAAGDPGRSRAGLPLRDLGRDGRVDRAVDSDHIARPDELGELDVVDMATRAEHGSVQHDEQVVMVGAHLGHGVALDAGPDGQGWKPNTSLGHILGAMATTLGPFGAVARSTAWSFCDCGRLAQRWSYCASCGFLGAGN
jgi:hypothetical protein